MDQACFKLLLFIMQVGGVNASQTAVYEEFARSIPGFQPPAAGESITTPPLPKPVQYEHGILGNAEVSSLSSVMTFTCVLCKVTRF